MSKASQVWDFWPLGNFSDKLDNGGTLQTRNQLHGWGPVSSHGISCAVKQAASKVRLLRNLQLAVIAFYYRQPHVTSKRVSSWRGPAIPSVRSFHFSALKDFLKKWRMLGKKIIASGGSLLTFYQRKLVEKWKITALYNALCVYPSWMSVARSSWVLFCVTRVNYKSVNSTVNFNVAIESDFKENFCSVAALPVQRRIKAESFEALLSHELCSYRARHCYDLCYPVACQMLVFKL
jgi:hypothetical protein